jgi:hypothetical protein
MKRLAIVILVGCGSKSPKGTSVETPSQPTSAACDRMIDAAAFTRSLGEPAPMAVRDESRQDAEATAMCSLVRGGTRLTQEEQQQLLEKQGRLGVLPGDPLCQVAAYCGTDEDVKRECPTRGGQDDQSMGSYACLKVVPTGAYDVHVYRFLDEDSGCVLRVFGGPANIDNESIRTCAKTARDTIDRSPLR